MTNPLPLKPGDKIGIVSPSRKIDRGKLDAGIELLEGWGLEVVTGAHVYSAYNQFGGTDRERASDLQQMFDNDGIKAVICSRGGYGTVRIIDKIDFSRFVSNPKWIVGYSDITVLHSHVNRLFGISTMHGSMPAELAPGKEPPVDPGSLTLLKEALFGNLPRYSLPVHPLSRTGEATGQIVGGNLSVLFSLLGSRSAPDPHGKILFIEDVGEYLYHIDRMMVALSRCGWLETVRGLVVGGMTDMNDNEVPFGKTAEEIIAGAVEEYDYPVCFGFPAGHQSPNNPLVLGREAFLRVGETTTTLSY
jgi:muramoyltetrapeptide carboxypeptidase